MIFLFDSFCEFSWFFFVFSVFADCFAKFKCFCTLNDLLFYITDFEIHFLVPFALKFYKHFAYMFHCIDLFIAFFVSIWFEQFVWSFLWNFFFHNFAQSVLQWFCICFNLSTLIKHKNMKIFSFNFFNFVTSIFLYTSVCLSFIWMLFNKILIKINMWSND